MPEIITLLNYLSAVMSKTKQKQLQVIIEALLSMRGRITMLGMSRWSEKGGSYRTIQRFFHSKFNWLDINWFFIQKHLIKKGSVYLLGGDEVVVSKSGASTHGLDFFYSSIHNKVIKSIMFLNISLIDVTSRKAYPLVMKQIVKESKEGCIKDKSKKVKSKPKKHNKAGRPKGSKNKNKKDVELSPFLQFTKEAINKALTRINKEIDILYFVYDGAFGNNYAMQMLKQCHLEIISKLQRNSALHFLNEEEYKGVGTRRRYGTKIDYNNLPNKFLKQTQLDEKERIETKIYQMEMMHHTFAENLNIVIIHKHNIKTNKVAHIILFSSDLNLEYEKIIDYYSLRFQIEFVFRDAKQYWGLEDFMSIKETAVNNWANLSIFMVNFSHGLRKDTTKKEMSVLDLKAHYHGAKYVKEVFKLLPDFDNEHLIKKAFCQITNLGAINGYWKVA